MKKIIVIVLTVIAIIGGFYAGVYASTQNRDEAIPNVQEYVKTKEFRDGWKQYEAINS